MKLYNTLSHTVEEFRPYEEGVVRMYTCGPTVYHYAHIGNLRSYITQDVLEKGLRYLGYQVIRVMNITDVGHLTSDSDSGEDKMVKGAKREHKSVMEIAKMYTDAFFQDFKELGNKVPDIVSPATDHIQDYIHIIEVLLEKGYAYQSAGNIYFDVTKLPDYYVLTNHKADDMVIGAREGVSEDAGKKNQADFVLWFTKSKFEDQELKWDSPWGVGYPGWHLECSAISMKYLGEHLDLHCGGIDNIFPHHTNEIAQCEAYLGHPWCRHWFHSEHLVDHSGKMSKSSGEFLTLSVLKEKGYDPLAYRYFCLNSHYRKALLFSFESLDSAEKAYEKLRTKTSSLKEDGALDLEKMQAYRQEFREALENDLNTASMVTTVYDLLKDDTLNEASKRKLVAEMDQVLSLDLLLPFEKKMEPVDQEILDAIAKRNEAKKNKDFALADTIRDQLLEKGIRLLDTREGTTYEKIRK